MAGSFFPARWHTCLCKKKVLWTPVVSVRLGNGATILLLAIQWFTVGLLKLRTTYCTRIKYMCVEVHGCPVSDQYRLSLSKDWSSYTSKLVSFQGNQATWIKYTRNTRRRRWILRNWWMSWASTSLRVITSVSNYSNQSYYSNRSIDITQGDNLGILTSLSTTSISYHSNHITVWDNLSK